MIHVCRVIVQTMRYVARVSAILLLTSTVRDNVDIMLTSTLDSTLKLT